jgi:hypothetical protein
MEQEKQRIAECELDAILDLLLGKTLKVVGEGRRLRAGHGQRKKPEKGEREKAASHRACLLSESRVDLPRPWPSAAEIPGVVARSIYSVTSSF